MTKVLNHPLYQKYSPCEPCGCDICRSYCRRPGWWLVEEAEKAIRSGLAGRMMMEVSPDFSFGVLSPAFRGCEMDFALQEYAGNGCVFFSGGLCVLHGTGLQPLECRYCHHTRQGLGQQCHDDIGRDWKTAQGQRLMNRWGHMVGLWLKYQK